MDRGGGAGVDPLYNSKTGEVVASWMTKLDRVEAIADNTRYAGAVLEKVRAELGVAPPIVFVGFSQGTAMAYRAALGAGPGLCRRRSWRGRAVGAGGG